MTAQNVMPPPFLKHGEENLLTIMRCYVFNMYFTNSENIKIPRLDIFPKKLFFKTFHQNLTILTPIWCFKVQVSACSRKTI